jgi:hypothetical protein
MPATGSTQLHGYVIAPGIPGIVLNSYSISFIILLLPTNSPLVLKITRVSRVLITLSNSMTDGSYNYTSKTTTIIMCALPENVKAYARVIISNNCYSAWTCT